MLRHSRRRVFLVTLLLILGLSSGAIIARQPFPAGIQQALITLGLWPYGVYANGEIPVWSAASNRFMPGSGGGGLRAGIGCDVGKLRARHRGCGRAGVLSGGAMGTAADQGSAHAHGRKLQHGSPIGFDIFDEHASSRQVCHVRTPSLLP